ncbi:MULTISPECIES: hypothetical protein [Sorangium]|uniref:PEGA domain-containing protein n=1 Tax=Sorangium cellulosum TaxID=56 RepID=A0A4P2R4U8_SORCE|nr:MULTISPECIES: hypothetical protein [Sorangium]AUX37796.1 uncharacterized protein SOCE836_100310 [Sorangium cellulosum]WCQ97087.1 hypothetical protein NQZ70_09878 [Sorangium sp. Soce836]
MRLLGVCLAVLLASAVARAEPPRRGMREQTIQAANRAVAEHRLADARELWRALWEAAQAPEAACNIGQLSSRMGELVTAREYLAICVRLDANEAHRIELARVEARLGRLIVRADPDVIVRVDGRELDPAVHETWVRAGDHLVEVERAGRRASAPVLVPAGERRQVTLELPPERPELPPERPAPRPARRPSPPPAPGPTWPMYVGLAGAATAAVVGGTALALAEDRRVTAVRRANQISPMNGCAAPRPGCDEVTDIAEEHFTLRTVAIGAFIGAALLGAGTGVYWYLQPDGASVTVARRW